MNSKIILAIDFFRTKYYIFIFLCIRLSLIALSVHGIIFFVEEFKGYGSFAFLIPVLIIIADSLSILLNRGFERIPW